MSRSAAGLRVLFVTPVAPRADAHDGGSRVMAGTIAALSSRHEVGILYLHGPGESDIGSLVDRCEFVEAVPRPWATDGVGRLIRHLRLASGLATGRPLWAGRWRVPCFGERLQRIVDNWRPDIVQFEYHIMGQYASVITDRLVGRVLVEHEGGEATARETRLRAHGAAALTAALDNSSWRRYERRIARAMDRVVVFTERDRDALLPLCGDTPVVRIPFGVSIPATPADPLGAEPPTLLFVGSFRHFPNEDAARRLVVDIFPLVRAARPDARLVLVGSNPPPWLLAAAGGHVEIPGSVSDLRPYLERAAVIAAPIRLGGGMRVKVLEALAAGKAVVSTRLGIEGLAIGQSPPVMLAESDCEFATRIAELINSSAARRDLATASRAWAIKHTSWDLTETAYEQLYTSIVRQRKYSNAVRGTAGTAGMRL